LVLYSEAPISIPIISKKIKTAGSFSPGGLRYTNSDLSVSLSNNTVGATIGRPPDFVAQNLIAARRLSVISFRNPNNCTAIVGRTANGRPYNAPK